MMFDMISAESWNAAGVLERYDAWTAEWHRELPILPVAADLQTAVERLHRANFELWHEEDKARDVHAGDAAIAAAKRAIDRVNQLRNDHIEQCDDLLLAWLGRQGLPSPQAELSSETPGLMLDRLSILSLKRYHTLEEVQRGNAPAGHAERNRQRLAILEMQRNDLGECLDRLWQRVLRRELRFRVYRQLKMYNDPELNPVLYGGKKAGKKEG